MKKILSLILAAALVMSLALPAYAVDSGISMEDVQVQEADTVEVFVSLKDTITGNAMALEYTYDNAVLEPIMEACRWIPDGTINDFDATYAEAVWASDGQTDISGEICVLTFRILDMQNFQETKVSCDLTIKNNSEVVAVYQNTAKIFKNCDHQFDDWKDADGSTHTRQCVLCGETQVQPHEWVLETVTADPANPGVAVAEFKCSGCPAKKQDEILRTLNDIQVSSKPDKTLYLQNKDTLDVTGGQLTLSYDDGSTEIIDMTADMVTGFDNTVLGQQKLTVTYGGYTTYLYVTVRSDPDATSGTWGDNLTWAVDDYGTLTISGYGDMVHFQEGHAAAGNAPYDGYPWHTHADSITFVTVEEGVTSLAEIAFHGLKNLSDVQLPESLTTIGDGSFAFCTALARVRIPENVSSLGKEVFYGCTNLPGITFTGDAPVFDPATFGDVTLQAYYPARNNGWTYDVLQNYGGSITWVPYGGPVTSGLCGDDVSWRYEEGRLIISGSGDMYSYGYSPAPWAAFKDQISLVSVDYGVTNAGEGAFAGLTALNQVYLPDTVTEIAYAAFRNCTSLPAVTVPNSVTAISYNAFENCTDLQNVTLSENVTSICYDAFRDCSSLKEVVFPENLSSIEERAFYSCINLGEMTFTGSAPSIGRNAFAGVFASANYPAQEDSWTTDVMKDYGGSIHWIPYGGAHVHAFSDWMTDGKRFCQCGYVEEKLLVDGENIEIGAPEQPELEFEVEPVKPADEEYILVEQAFSPETEVEQEVLRVYDINLVDNAGNAVQPDGTVKVKLPLDWSKALTYKVYRVNPDGTLTDMNAYRQGSHVVFETDHFSLYVVVEEYLPGDTDGSGSVTGEDAIYLVWHTLFPQEYPLEKEIADYNANGIVDDLDAVDLLFDALQ